MTGFGAIRDAAAFPAVVIAAFVVRNAAVLLALSALAAFALASE